MFAVAVVIVIAIALVSSLLCTCVRLCSGSGSGTGIVLYCIVLYCIVLCCMHCIVLCCKYCAVHAVLVCLVLYHIATELNVIVLRTQTKLPGLSSLTLFHITSRRSVMYHCQCEALRVNMCMHYTKYQTGYRVLR